MIRANDRYYLRIGLLVLFILHFSHVSVAQSTKLDSLWSVWKDEGQSDSKRLSAIDDIIWEGYLFRYPDSAFYFAGLQYEFALSNGDKKQMAKARNIQGISYTLRGDYPKSLEYHQLSLEIQEELKSKQGIAVSLTNIGLIYSNQGNYPKALIYLEKSLAINEEINDIRQIAAALSNLGLIYDKQENYPAALEYHLRSLAIHEELGDKEGISVSLGNIGRNYQFQGDYEKAFEYHNRSLAIRTELDNKLGIANSLSSIGFIYKQQEKYPEALEHYQRSLTINEAVDYKKGVASSLNSIGGVYQIQGDYRNALNYCKKGLDLAQTIEILEEQKAACECLYNAYKSTGNGNLALAYHEQMLVLDDSLMAKETSKQLQQMEFAKKVLQDSIATAEKERLAQEAYEADVREEKQTRNVFIGSSILLLLVAGGLFTRWKYVRKSKAIIEAERDRSDNLLLNILPEEIARELKENGRAEARDYEQVSILFTDFKSFTEHSARLSAADLVNEINHCFEAFDGIIEKYGIEKIKTIGDAYMAAGGLPIPVEDSVRHTVLAALDMQEFILRRKADKEAKGESGFEMRVGIHTGQVVAGIVGVKKFQYDIWGDTVNTASRIESSGEAGRVNISQQTYALLKDDPDFIFENRGKIDAKGKGSIDMFFVSKKEHVSS